MNHFIIGQRWISRSESELGLGIIIDSTSNRVTVLFLAANERRVYAVDNAPLTRVQFLLGDLIENDDGFSGVITDISEQEGLIRYQMRCEDNDELISFDEMALNAHLQFNKPQERLFMGQAEAGRWFSLRYDTWQHKQRLQQSDVAGLMGVRASLIPHQLYIAHEAAKREQVRIMLADEVGLGKTIEAGLILHQRLHLGLAARILIIVPESLLHQWLVEMLRRFNLMFSLLDEERCVAIEEDNPFLTTQLALCSLDFFEENSSRKAQAIAAGWDMVVVDEAHHLQWHQETPSEAYAFVERLSQSVEGLILLTATPEQLGKQTHFAQLRLLDADRFYDFEVFQEEEQHFQPIAQLAEKINHFNEPLNSTEETLLLSLVDKSLSDAFLQNADDKSVQAAILEQLIDRHGTGRVLFRNSRQVVKGFPERELHHYALPDTDNTSVIWLVDFLKSLADEQVLLICKTPEMVLQLQKSLRDKYAIKVAVFHEGMSIIERDRAAAYFSDAEAGVQVLLCSEIGSEGRNFQFVHHLILWDLPENPDLLQQRIGRLDRIGQQHIIQIHVPYIIGSTQHSLCRWYDEGLQLFQHNSNAASEVYRLQADSVAQVCASDYQEGIDALVVDAQKLITKIETEMHQSRDLLLELNSFRQEPAYQLIDKIRALSEPMALWRYMETIFDCFGIDSDYHSKDCSILRAESLQRVSHFPYIPEDGVTVTINRQSALAREDMQYLTWEHPMVLSAMDLVLSDYIGNAAFSVVKHPNLEAGQYLIECLFLIECSAPSHLQLGRFLPVTPLRFLINQEQTDVSDMVLHDDLNDVRHELEHEQITEFMSAQHQSINALIAVAEKQATQQMNSIIADATTDMLAVLSAEIKRLKALGKVNLSIKPTEIEALKEKAIVSHDCINQAKLRLDAVRFIITS